MARQEYQDFLGETPEEEEARLRREAEARVNTPESRAAQDEAARRQTAFENAAAEYNQKQPGGSVSRAGQWRSETLGSGERVATVSPGQYGQFSYNRTGRPDNYTAPTKGWKDAFMDTLDITSSAFNNPVLNPIGYGAKKGGGYIDGKAGTSVSGYIQDPLGQALDDVGAPDAVQLAANPTGFATRNAVSSGTSYGVNVPQAGKNLITSGQNVNNDVNAAKDAIKDAAGYVSDAFGGIGGREVTSDRTGGAGTGTGSSATRPENYRTDTVSEELRRYLDEERNASGPSEAEALLSKATDRVAAQSLGIAAGARGGAGARERAMRGAQSANVALGAEAGSNLAALRAREAQERKARIQGLLGLLGANASQGDARDLGYYESDNSRDTALINAEAARDFQREQYNASNPAFMEDPISYLAKLFNRPDPTPTRL